MITDKLWLFLTIWVTRVAYDHTH